MNKKHFEAMAQAIRQMYQTAKHLGDNQAGQAMLNRAQGAEDAFVGVAQDFNPRFDSIRFRQACRA